MPGKYESFRKLYPKVPLEATAFERINAVLDAPAYPEDGALRVRDLDNTKLQELYVMARKAMEPLEARLKVLGIQVDALEYLFHERMEEDDMTSIKFANGMTLGSSVEPYPSVNDRAVLMGWVKSTGQEELLTLNYQTLATIVKTAILEGKELPPGVDVFMKTKMTARGLKDQPATQEK